MAVSYAWRMVSKLNVNPFQAVNSPLVEPVNMKTVTSGVHWERHQAGKRQPIRDQNLRTLTAFTQHRLWFVDVWMNFVQSDVEALSG